MHRSDSPSYCSTPFRAATQNMCDESRDAHVDGAWSSCPWRITVTIEKGSAKRQLVATTSTRARTGGRLRRLRDDLCVSVSILERVNVTKLGSTRCTVRFRRCTDRAEWVCSFFLSRGDSFHGLVRPALRCACGLCPVVRRRRGGASPAVGTRPHDTTRTCDRRPHTRELVQVHDRSRLAIGRVER